MPEVSVGLAEAIRELRRELTEAMAEGQDQQIRFELGPVEMEFLLEITKAAEGDAGVRFWVISLGGKGSVSSGSTHRVNLSLTPRKHSPGAPPVPLEISDAEKSTAKLREETRADGGHSAGSAQNDAGQRSAGGDAS
jgi:hypothetical protein